MEGISTQEPLESLELSFKNISYKVKEKGKHDKLLLNDLNGCFRTGQLTAIMGPSGAGKTTLLNVLAGNRNNKVKNGEIRINGAEITTKQFRQQSSYIMQESELFSMLTVMESMYIASCLKLPSNTPYQDKINSIMEILVSLGLEECLNVRAGNLSGGEQKRLFIAQELLSNLQVMFLDEPTSGLDTVSANQCVSVLKKLSENGKMVVITIHQPSELILEKFDHLYFLSQGQCFYQGPVSELVPFLQTFGLNCPQYHNPADYATEIACLEYGEDNFKKLVDRVTLDFENKNNIPDQNIPLGVNTNASSRNLVNNMKILFNEITILIRRYLLCRSRDLIRTYLLLFSFMMCGLILGLVYQGRGYYANDASINVSSLVLVQLIFVFISIMSSVLFFPLEFEIFKREYMNGWYKLLSYFIAKLMIDIPMQALCCLIFVSIFYLMTSQPIQLWRFLLFYIVSLLAILNSYVVGFLIGVIVKIKEGAFIGSAFIIIAGLLSGTIFVSFKDTRPWLYWISFTNYLRYTWQGFNAVIYYDRETLPCREDTTFCHFKYTKTIFSYFGIEQESILVCIFAMTILLLFKLILTYFVLKYKVKNM